MAYSREQIFCVFCGNNTNEKGRIQFNSDGNVIGCCENCLKYAKLFVKVGRKVKPTGTQIKGQTTIDN